jgi:putative spermidine/putrescine transport system substrate-binding protein
MAGGEVVIESMWFPAVALLQAQAFPVRYGAPPEGFRAFSQGLAISARVTDPDTLHACYEYINWWHSGEPGAVMMRQGYYPAVMEASRAFAEPGEYGYWIEGQPADKDYPGPFGDVSIRQGQIRDGGSFAQRACRTAAWTSEMEEQPYLFARWEELLSA